MGTAAAWEHNPGVELKVLYFEGCPSWQVTVQRLRNALAIVGHGAAAIELVPVQPGPHLASTGFAGSPTLVVDGEDLFPGAPAVAELTCRLYPTSEGLRGCPSVAELVAALSTRVGARETAR